MTLELWCTIFYGIMCLMMKVDTNSKSKTFNKINKIIPKINGVLIFSYLILKYVFKLS